MSASETAATRVVRAPRCVLATAYDPPPSGKTALRRLSARVDRETARAVFRVSGLD
ncbi:hypothetical protein [Streptomyces sp. NPDC048665]|uniref:hypothetical protein n=1 Tax=Streptomyces sp. NPDC048665 TaxID=3155490 RepID=UPI00341E6ADC